MSGERITTTMKMRKANLSVVKKVNGKDHREKVLPKNPTKDGTNLKVTFTNKGRKKPPPSPYFFCDGPIGPKIAQKRTNSRHCSP
ncbi:hypothetical protein EUGRSUZ_H05123 [Eucalyptus grandis]|uniref:Uncharacterized protein n=2 Tax=Eucalyptus grandis TaxID=71139 RepID=A0ACC3JZ42_EUCGR|nr:hypothetical protein EUGRSUZ_H05123 [Eucalyptus grandis]